MKFLSLRRALPIALLFSLLGAKFAFAQEEEPASVEMAYYAIDNMILFIAAVLVLFMQAGFGMVEAGFNAGKNTVNILFKNLMDLSIGALIYFFVGYGLMYGADISVGLGLLAWGGVGIGSASAPGPGVLNPQVDWLFQVAFAATAKPGDFAGFAPKVFDHAAQGDIVAEAILAHGQAVIEASLLRFDLRPDEPLALLGGLAPLYETRLSAPLRALVRPSLQDALGGAVSMAARLFGAQRR